MSSRDEASITPLSTRQADAVVVAVNDDVLSIESLGEKPLMKNEVVFVMPSFAETSARAEKLKAEVLRVKGKRADVQVYEDTSGIAIGDPVEQTGAMLSVELGPGLLRQVFDGLQNPLHRLELMNGRFLLRGAEINPLDRQEKWAFSAELRVGDSVYAGDTLGSVQEGRFRHKIMVPFGLAGEYRIDWIQEGSFTADTVVVRLKDDKGRIHELSMIQRWPIRVPLPEKLLKHKRAQKRYPCEPMLTSLRLIDTFFPIAKGGTACIPGPFGAGKTVLQNLISRYSDVDIVIVVACGERAGEVVETISEFPRLQDPHTGGTLMDRTIIICNTSSMPVAAREASIYTGVSIGEYYRQMGYNVLLLADSTSRWAQAMRETSGRLEEIPGEEAFPAYLESSIKNLYERAGLIQTADGATGSLTLIGTVSPAGGNFEEPVTQGTLNTVKAFLGLSYERAYKRFYPAVDPLQSWSRYQKQLAPWFANTLGGGWNNTVQKIMEILRQGEDISRMMQVTGEEGISNSDYILQQKAALIDLVFLQQDAFDEVDVSTPLERQKRSLELLKRIVDTPLQMESKNDIRQWFNRLCDRFKNMNYSVFESEAYKQQLSDIQQMLATNVKGKS